jgi:phosphatidylinositol 4-phosphatase
LFFNSYFYFSDGGKYDLSKTLQKQNEPDSQESFVWNSTMLLDEKITSSFFTKVIQGFVSIEKIDEKIKFAVVSRRSKFRAGTRYNRRGVDDEGNAANFVQTEQILETEKNSNSFVILRFYFFF